MQKDSARSIRVAIFQIAKNNEQNFLNMADTIGPPARMMRWCCSMFKTGPITRVLNNMYRNQQVLTFYGIRKAESVSRSKYNRVEDSSESVKINKQTVASPIFFWMVLISGYISNYGDCFNDAYVMAMSVLDVGCVRIITIEIFSLQTSICQNVLRSGGIF